MASAPLPDLFETWRADSLFDPSPGAGWADDELLGAYNEAVRVLAATKPETFVRRDELELEAGSDQVLPDDAVVLIDLTENLDGSPITLVDDELLREARRFSNAPAARVHHFATDPRVRTRFQVWPPAIAGTKVRGRWGYVPAAAALDTDAGLLVGDDLLPFVRQWMVSVLFSRPGPRTDAARAASAMNAAMSLIGQRVQGGVAAVPQEPRP